MSYLTGQRESVEQREGFSYGANTVRDGVSIQSERRQEPLILPTEFLRLNDKEAYMVLPGEIPISKIKLKFRKRKVFCESRPIAVVEPLLIVREKTVESPCNLQNLKTSATKTRSSFTKNAFRNA
jgi:type IV secretory pathway TraG/TraD family ATPase VirD4